MDEEEAVNFAIYRGYHRYSKDKKAGICIEKSIHSPKDIVLKINAQIVVISYRYYRPNGG